MAGVYYVAREELTRRLNEGKNVDFNKSLLIIDEADALLKELKVEYWLDTNTETLGLDQD